MSKDFDQCCGQVVEALKNAFRPAVEFVFYQVLALAAVFGIVTVDGRKGRGKTIKPLRVCKADVDALMESMAFHVVRVPNTTAMVALAILPSGFVVATGMSACIDPASFNAHRGREIATHKARVAAEAKLWELEGYALGKRLDEAEDGPAGPHDGAFVMATAHGSS